MRVNQGHVQGYIRYQEPTQVQKAAPRASNLDMLYGHYDDDHNNKTLAHRSASDANFQLLG